MVEDGDKVEVNVIFVILKGLVCVLFIVECIVFNFL